MGLHQLHTASSSCGETSGLLLTNRVTHDIAGAAELQAAAGAEGYTNRYRNGWGASAAAHRAAVEEARRNKRGTGPTVSQMAAPLPLSRFTWPVTPVSTACISCRCSRLLCCTLHGRTAVGVVILDITAL